jgi:hypothetical protein
MPIFDKILPIVDAGLAIIKAFEGHEGEYCGVGRAGTLKAAELAKSERDGVTHGAASVLAGSSNMEKGKDAAGETGYWDDYCLAQFLRGVCLRYIAYPVGSTSLQPRHCY